MTDATSISYWRWLFRGSGGKAGIRRFCDRWLLLHLAVGGILAIIVKDDLATCANAVLLPLAGILVGLSFAWAGNAQALMQTSEMDELANHHEGGFVAYVFVYQTAILTILVTMVLWGMAGLKVFDAYWPTSSNPMLFCFVKAILFVLSSLTLRECWHVVMGAQWMLLFQRAIKKSRQRNKHKH